MLLLTHESLPAKMTAYIDEIVTKGSLHKTHLDVLHLLPNEYLERSLKRRIAAMIASLPSPAQEPISLRLLLAYTHDDPGNALVCTSGTHRPLMYTNSHYRTA